MSADFKPDMRNFKDLTPFRFWCQKVLPTCYDDSLSYYEVLCKVKDTLNNIIENMNNLHLDMEDMYTAYEQLEDYVNHYFDNLDVQEEINNKLDVMAEDGTLSALVSPFVTEQVTAQIGDTVAVQIGDTVAGQIGDTVASQLPSAIGTQVTDWLTAHVTPVSEPVVIDNTLTIEGACADAKAAGDRITDLKSAINNFPSHLETVDVTKQGNKRWQYYDNFDLIDAQGYYACSFSVDEETEYLIQARNVGINTTFAIAFFSGSTPISSIIDAPTTETHTVTVKTPSGCDSVRFTTNNESQPPIYVRKKVFGKMEAVYVSLSGSDGWTGEKEHPFQTIQKAIDTDLSDTIIVGSGRFQAPISASNRKKLHITGAIDGTTVIDYTTTISPTLGSLGVKEALFSSTASDLIYKVFVSQELPLYTDGNARAYTVNLWTYDGLTLLIPKATVNEVILTSNTWTYDGSKIYVNCDAANYKLVNTYEDVAGTFENIQELIIENITFKYSGYSNCEISDCGDVKVTNCEFSNSGRQHGLALENCNAMISKCNAFRNCYDGFNIHQKGNSTFIDCESGYNRDDGVSHHDGSTGTVIGGEYHHNNKGGISPTYDSKVNIYNAECNANGYGIYYAVATDTITCVISGCVLTHNNGYGLRVNGNYSISSYGTLYDSNNERSKADGGGSIYSLGGN